MTGGENMNTLKLTKKSLDEVKVIAKQALDLNKITFKSQVVAVFDISGSMEGWGNSFYKSGIMDALATRVLALGLQLDDDGEIPVYTLGSGTRRLPNLTKENLDGYINKAVAPLVGEGTQYAPFIEKIIEDSKEGDPMLVLVFTDGDNSDHAATKEAIIKASNLPIFFQWYGIYSGQPESFPFLAKLDTLNGRVIDNAGFSTLGLNMDNGTPSAESNVADAGLYNDMLKEYKDYPELAQKNNVTWANKAQLGRKKLFGIF